MNNSNELYSKIKRQIEIIGLCLKNKEILRKPDLADIFNCEEPTIKRDLNELRSSGIDIHSTKKEGVFISKSIDQKTISDLTIQYLSTIISNEVYDKASTTMIHKLKEEGLVNLVILQKCIEDKCIAEIDYILNDDEILKTPIAPLLFFQSDGNWRILAINDNIIKQYLLLKISKAQKTKKHFTKPPVSDIENLFKYSFNSWLSNEKIEIKIQINKSFYTKIKNRILLNENTKINETDDSLTIEMCVNSLDEIAEWIAGKGDNIKVIEPVELKDKVVKIAKEILKKYK